MACPCRQRGRTLWSQNRLLCHGSTAAVSSTHRAPVTILKSENIIEDSRTCNSLLDLSLQSCMEKRAGQLPQLPLEMCEGCFLITGTKYFLYQLCDGLISLWSDVSHVYNSAKLIQWIWQEKICSTGIKHKTLKKHKHSSFNQWERALNRLWSQPSLRL